MNIEGWYTVRQAGRELGLQPNTVRWHINQGNLIAIYEQGRYRISRNELDAFIATRTQIEDYAGGLVEAGYYRRSYKKLKRQYIELFTASALYKVEVREFLAEVLKTIDYEQGKPPYANQALGLCVSEELLDRLRQLANQSEK